MSRPADTAADPVLDPPEHADINLQIIASFDAVSTFLVDLRNALDLRVGYATGRTWEVVLAEYLNNIVEHAYAGTSDGAIKLWLTCDGAMAHIVLQDTGVALPDHEVPLPLRPDVQVETEAVPEGGFGWFLIHSLCSDLRYVRKGAENWASFRVSLSG